MANQIVISSGAKVRNLNGVLTGTTGVVNSLGINVANGIPQLDGSGKILVSQLPNSVMEYKGTWNAATNTPTLANGTGNQGDVYLCSTAGTVNFGAGAITFAVGDQVIYSGTIWQKAGGSTGTVTSVAVTESGDALTITGSPITTSGTINIGFAGTTGQYVNGAGGLTTFPTLTGFVPYTGATSNVALGEFGLSGGYIGLDTTPTSTPTSVGTLSWDTTYKTPKVITGTGNTTLQIGQEEVILIHNGTGSALTDGQVVYITGSTGDLPSVSLADASSETTSAATLGVVTEPIANGSNGFVTVSGMVNGLNTLAYNEGDLLWLSETAGAFTNVKPISPAHLVLIGYVIKKAGGNGSILVKIQNTQELEECSDVLFTSLANNDILAYESSTDLWKNKTIANVLGYTPQAQLTLTTTGTSGAATLTGATLNIPNYTTDLSNYVTLNGIQTITGEKTFSNNTLKLAATGTGGLVTYLSNISGTGLTSSGSNALGFNINNDIYFAGSDKVGGVFSFNNTAVRTYTLQNANGTLAFTSDIPTVAGVYLPLAGGTLTGALNINLSGSTGLNVASDGVIFRSNTGVGAPRQIVLSSGGGPTALIEAKGYGANYNTDLSIKTYNSSGTGFDVFFATSGGNVGIGTTAPLSKLQVVGTGTVVRFGEESGTTGKQLLFGINSSNGTSEIQSVWQGTANTNLALNPAGGNVGIGTSSPSSILNISSSVNNVVTDVESQFRILNTYSGGVATIGFSANGSDGQHGRAGIVSGKDSGSVSGYLAFVTRINSGAFGEAMRVTSGGNVGIGTSSPSYKLDIQNGSDFDVRIRDNSAGGTVGLLFETANTFSGTSQAFIKGIGYGSAGYSELIFGTSGTSGSVSATERMRISAGGVLCVARTSAPSDGYSAVFGGNGTQDAVGVFVNNNGNNAINFFNGSGSYVASISVNASSVAYNTSSDYRLKQDLKDFNGLDLVSAIKTYDYEWKSDQSRAFGVIAHELAEVIPYAVSGVKDGEQIQGVDYSKLVPILIKAIQELEARIKQLENK